MPYNSVRYPRFTLEQLTTFSTWNVVRPVELSVRVATDHERFPEVAMLFRYDPEDVRYLMNATNRGTVVLVRSSGGKWELPTVEAALAKVLLMETWSVTASKVIRPKKDLGTALHSASRANPAPVLASR